ncbi:NB-ARC domain-containing protein [Corchorus olitorius]|uniref:NB-ARC domain-containing protein n=1 Tax=Corchorus olitorius TaxID=93759 RepID=A0A1R3FX95_9ROSI|nr:NB-ARC domain-containing protein [Corchorus olitorius]
MALSTVSSVVTGFLGPQLTTFKNESVQLIEFKKQFQKLHLELSTMEAFLKDAERLSNRVGNFIMTSRDENALLRMGVHKRRINFPKELNDHDSWLLFQKIAFAATAGKSVEHWFREYWEGNCRKCIGVLLMMRTVVGMMASNLPYSHLMEAFAKDVDMYPGKDTRLWTGKRIKEIISKIADLEQNLGYFKQLVGVAEQTHRQSSSYTNREHAISVGRDNDATRIKSWLFESDRFNWNRWCGWDREDHNCPSSLQ